MKFDTEQLAMLIAIALWAASCGSCGTAYFEAHGRAYEACVSWHQVDECGGLLP